MIIDSSHQPHNVLIQNPADEAPDEIMGTLGLMNVDYVGFDGEMHQGQIIVATEVMPEVEAFFRHAVEHTFPIAKVVPVSAPEYLWNGEKVLKDNVSSGFDYRPIRDTGKLSQHSKGLAFDVNPQQNPYIRYDQDVSVPEGASYNPLAPGTLHGEHPLVKLMEGFGWEWGGRWTKESGRTDYMHFQKT